MLWPDRDRICRTCAHDLNGMVKAVSRCRKFHTVIQAGGNVGVWPSALELFFKDVYTFEPSPENFSFLEKNYQGKHAYNAALYDKEGFVGIKENAKNCGDDRTCPGDEIPAITIDSLGIYPNLIYLDIQGDESRALLGGEETIKKSWPVIAIEISTQHLDENFIHPGELLESWGYELKDRYQKDYIFESIHAPRKKTKF